MRTFARTLLLSLVLAIAPAASAVAGAAVPARGHFTADVDFTTLAFEEAAQGAHCELTVSGTLTFIGTLEGSAEGTTTAYVLAPCEQAIVPPPGTYRDVFRFTGTFTGTVAGTPTTGELGYFGVTHPGGNIDATIQLRDTAKATLRADAIVAVGGTYEGVAQP